MEKEVIIKFFFNEGNWGDKISPLLVEMISGVKPELVPMKERFIGNKNQHVYLTVGSVLKFADSNTIVWGAGFIRQEDSLSEKPYKICAVRGPISRQKLLDQGIECPEVYGDPVLLLPRYYTPEELVRKKIGIIPHYVDQDHPWLKNFINNNDVRIIDIKGDYHNVVNEICSCDLIISSSLHGLIVPDAYGIPSVWVKFSDKIWGGNFKFLDYFASVGRKEIEPLQISEHTSLTEVLGHVEPFEFKLDLNALYESCPFKK